MSLKDLLPKVKLERESEVRKKVAIGATIGLTVGAVAGVLLAPKTGKETREELLKNIQELPDKAKALSEKTQEKLGEVKEKITEETHKIMTGEKETLLDIDKDLYNELHPKELTAKVEVETDAYKGN